jgi:hypothetical protein
VLRAENWLLHCVNTLLYSQRQQLRKYIAEQNSR